MLAMFLHAAERGISRVRLASCPLVLSVPLVLLCLGWSFSAAAAFARVSTQTEVEARIASLVVQVDAAREASLAEVQEPADEALSLLEIAADPAAEFAVRIDLSWVASRSGETELGFANAERALAIAEAQEELSWRAEACYHLALAYWYRCDLPEAFRCAREARDLQRENGEHAKLGSTLTLLGAIHRSVGEFRESLTCHFEALEIAERGGDERGIGRSRNNIGLVYWNLDDPEGARTYMEQVVPVYRRLDKDDELATVLGNLGLVLIELGEPQEALGFLEECVQIHERLDRPRALGKILGNIAFAYEEIGELELALGKNEEALVLRRELQDDHGIARSLGSIAGLHVAAERPALAVEQYEEALLAAERAGARLTQSQLYEGLATAYEALGRDGDALETFHRLHSLLEELELDETRRHLAELEARVAFKEQERSYERERRQQERALRSRARQRTVFATFSVVGLLGAAALFALYRARERSLSEVRRSHEELRVTAGRLRESETRYRSVFESAVLPKLLIDVEAASIVEANGQAESLCEVARGELEGRSLADLRPKWLAEVLDVKTQEACRVSEWRDAEGRTRHVRLWFSPVTIESRPCVVVTVHDVTERHRLEEERIRAGKLESLGLLAGGIAHDFNNALVGVLGHVSLARAQVEEGEVERWLAEAEKGIDHASHLTSQLLAFAKGGGPLKERRDIRRPLTDAVHFCLSGSNVIAELDIASDLLQAEVDATQFEQVVHNLVLNAVQAMPEGGTLHVRARNTVLAEAPIAGGEPGSFLRIDFRDEGSGIPVDVLPKIFDPYFTTKEFGSGLGLSTAFAIVSRHGGSLDVMTEQGLGTTFTVLLPSVEGGIANVAPRIPAGRDGSARILIMDDDPTVRATLGSILDELGDFVVSVSDGEAALEEWFGARRAGRPFDCAIMDLTVPGRMGGREAMARLRRRDPHAIGIVASGYAEDPVLAHPEQHGFSAVLRKPFHAKTVESVLGSVLAGSLSPRTRDTLMPFPRRPTSRTRNGMQEEPGRVLDPSADDRSPAG